jgi:hypothetical protein
VGPAILIPTATNDFLGSKHLALGPTVVALKQQHGWTVGVLWNHVWSVAGGTGRAKVNGDLIQPFLSYNTRDGWTYKLNTESNYDWTGNHWAVPIHFTISKVVRFGKQPVSFGGAMRCWATSPIGGPQGCGLRIIVTCFRRRNESLIRCRASYRFSGGDRDRDRRAAGSKGQPKKFVGNLWRFGIKFLFPRGKGIVPMLDWQSKQDMQWIQ